MVYFYDGYSLFLIGLMGLGVALFGWAGLALQMRIRRATLDECLWFAGLYVLSIGAMALGSPLARGLAIAILGLVPPAAYL